MFEQDHNGMGAKLKGSSDNHTDAKKENKTTAHDDSETAKRVRSAAILRDIAENKDDDVFDSEGDDEADKVMGLLGSVKNCVKM